MARNTSYDVVIKSHEKDYHKLALVVDSLQYLQPEPDGIYILTQDGFLPSGTPYDHKLVSVRDNEVLPAIDRTRLRHRPNWNWINLVSLTQSFTKNDLYLDVQSDNFFVRPISLFDESGRPRIFQSTENPVNCMGHKPYFNYSEAMFGLGKVSNGYSYIIEFMMYDRKLLREFFSQFGSIEEILEKSYSCVNNECYPADQELYGNMLEKHFPNMYEFVANVPVHLAGVGDGLNVTQEFLREYIRQVKLYRPEAVACSHHTWI